MASDTRRSGLRPETAAPTSTSSRRSPAAWRRRPRPSRADSDSLADACEPLSDASSMAPPSTGCARTATSSSRASAAASSASRLAGGRSPRRAPGLLRRRLGSLDMPKLMADCHLATEGFRYREAGPHPMLMAFLQRVDTSALPRRPRSACSGSSRPPRDGSSRSRPLTARCARALRRCRRTPGSRRCSRAAPLPPRGGSRASDRLPPAGGARCAWSP